MQYSDVSSPTEGSNLVTNGSGKVECTFRIPEYRFAGQEAQPRFRTGEIEFKLTSQATLNLERLPITSGSTIYNAVGVLETELETILASRNARVIQSRVEETTSLTDTSTTTKLYRIG